MAGLSAPTMHYLLWHQYNHSAELIRDSKVTAKGRKPRLVPDLQCGYHVQDISRKNVNIPLEASVRSLQDLWGQVGHSFSMQPPQLQA